MIDWGSWLLGYFSAILVIIIAWVIIRTITETNPRPGTGIERRLLCFKSGLTN